MATRALSRQRILEAAFAIADTQGLDAVTMRSVAASLDVEAMSLYHHVPNKKAMVAGLVDLLIQVTGLPSGDVTAEEWVRGTAAALRGLARKHPRLVPLLSLRAVPLHDPAAAEPFEAGLAAFVAGGRSVHDAYTALQAVLISLLSLTQLEAVAAGADPGTEEATALGELSEERFPLLHQVLVDDADINDFWTVLVDALVRGLGA